MMTWAPCHTASVLVEKNFGGGPRWHLLVSSCAMPYQHTLSTQATVYAEIAIVWNDCEWLPIVFQGQ